MATVANGGSGGSTTDGLSYTTGSITVAQGEYLVVFATVAGVSNAGYLGCTSSAGIVFGQAGSIVRSSTDTLIVFVPYLLVPTGVTSTTFTIFSNLGSGTVFIVHVYRVTGMSRAGDGSFRQVGSGTHAAGGTPTATLGVAAITSNPILVACMNLASPATLTPPGSWTEGYDTGYSTPTTGMESARRASGFTGTSIAWGATSATAGVELAIELNAALLPPNLGPKRKVVSQAVHRAATF